MTLQLVMKNDGCAIPYNPRNVELVLRDLTNLSEHHLSLSQIDPRRWLPHPGQTETIDFDVVLPSDLPPGQYELLLNFPDPAPTLRERSTYSIRLANLDSWEATTGYNRLGLSILLQ